MDMDKNKLGEFVVLLRKEKGMTQVELADKLHVSNKTISKWETGRGMPDVDMIISLAEALDVSVIELIKQERIDDQTVFTKEKVSDEITHSLVYMKRRKETMNEKMSDFMSIGLSFIAFYIIFLLLCLFSNFIYFISPIIGILVLIKGIWNLEAGKNYASTFTIAIMFLSAQYITNVIIQWINVLS